MKQHTSKAKREVEKAEARIQELYRQLRPTEGRSHEDEETFEGSR